MEKTNLNVNPYYDDFTEAKNFHKILFRPGFSVQARELTQLQSILQNQIERHGKHIFKEGTVVIPGSLSYTNEYYAVKLQSTYSSVDVSTYLSSYVGKTIVGSTTGVRAEVIEAVSATTTDSITLYVKYFQTGSDNETISFQDNETIYATSAITDASNTEIYSANTVSAQLLATNATSIGSSVNIEQGVYFVRGYFVQVQAQRLILEKYSNTPSYRIGFTITETLETPEEDLSLLDNAQGSTNLNAKGAHRLKINLTLSKLELNSENDGAFVELMRIDNGAVQTKTRTTEYSVLGDTLARRTYDESGDYYVKKFDLLLKETLNDGLNDGVYNSTETTDSGNLASEDYFTIQISPGKAYVKGYEIETLSPKYIDVLKPRTYNTLSGTSTAVEVGNYILVNNVFGTPEISPKISGEIPEPYKEVRLYNKATTTRGDIPSSGAHIGLARVRAFEHFEGNTGTSSQFLADATTLNSLFKLYLFDVRMFTTVTLSGTPAAGLAEGDKVIGQITGAYGLIKEVNGNDLILTGVVGSFEDGETLSCTGFVAASGDEIIEDSSNNNLTVSIANAYDFSSAKQVYMEDTSGGVSDPDFTADVYLDSNLTLSGLVSINGSSTTLNGSQTNFTQDLVVGDVIAIPSGANGLLQEIVITNITSDTVATISGTVSNTVTTVQATRKRAKLNDQNKNILLRKLQKNRIKTLKTTLNNGISDSIVTLRKQFVGTTNSGGSVTFTLGTGESFNSVTNTDYVLSVQSSGSGSAIAGDLINMNSSTMTVQNNSSSLVITDSTLFGSTATIHMIATITKSNINEKTKTSNKCYMVLAENYGVGQNAKYGTSAHHKEITLGKADVYRMRAIYESSDSSTNPVPPSWTYTSATGVLTKGELVTGATSGAKATVIRTDSSTSVFSFVSLNNISFLTGEIVTGEESGESIELVAFTEGSKDVTNKYLFDTGQRDNFYDISRIIRKSNSTTPVGKLLIVCDYFSHGAGDFFTVDSYSGQIDYKEIPSYTASRVDPEVREPTGNYDLRDTVDFRPKISDIALGAASSIYGENAYPVNDYSFNFGARNFVNAGSSVIDIPKDGSNFFYDLEYYLPRYDSLFLKKDGNFVVSSGAPSESPSFPNFIDDAMKIANLFIEPYVISVNNIDYSLIDNKRYTMRDIGNLEKRISNIEYYTTLNLLEQNTNAFQILDTNGLDRFKSGFIVDNFEGHSVGDPVHPDYRNSIDMINKILRPKHYMKNVLLDEEYSTDSERSTRSYQKTGDLLTLPYQHVVSINQPYATRIENLNPALFFTWAGECKLNPSEDEWFEHDRLPDLIINREGNFDTVLAQNRNALGTVWNSWQTQWSGQVVDTTTSEVAAREIFRDEESGRMMQRGTIVQRSATARTGTSIRTAITTQVVEQLDVQRNDRVLSVAVIPFIRAKNITFEAKGMKPLTKVYPFFDKTNVTQYVTPAGGNAGDSLITNASGEISGIFLLPNPNIRGNPRFRTGERVFRLTSNSTNSLINLETEAQAIYTASGTLTTSQLSIISTRNARVVRTAQTQQSRVQEVVSVGGVISRTAFEGWYDPLAQSFMVSSKGGEFLTKIDVYFQSKDNNIPVKLEIREMENGYPTGKVLPFSTVILNPGSVNISNNATAITTFTFDSPVYVDSDKEYCVVLIADSKNYNVWISRMGEQDVSGNRIVSDQPYLGVLFKSQNNTTWTAYDFEDLKFTLHRANFDTTTTGLVSYVNSSFPLKTLNEDPIVTYNGQNYVKVVHENHHMYNVVNNVTIDGVSSGITTQLTSTISAIAGNGDTFTIDSATNFPGSGTIFVKIGSDIISGTLASTTFTISTRTGTTEHVSGSTVELYMLNGIPLTEVNTTHTSLMSGKIGMDYYFIQTTTSANITDVGGGDSVTASENAMYNTMQTMIPYLNYADTSVTAKVQTTSSTSPAGSESSFNFESLSVANIIPVNDNYIFPTARMVCSQVNENNELSGNKSFRLTFELSSNKSNLSPVIDTNRKSFIAVLNRLNNIISSSDVFPATDYVFPTEPNGDNNEAIYITRQIQLKTPGNSIKLYLDAARPNSTNIDVMYRILRSDDASDFDELGWEFFNINGAPDTVVNASSTTNDFLEYEYTANNIPEFISFAIKIRMRGTNTSEVPQIKNLRALALAT